MSGLVVFSVPLYRLFCDLTGFQGFNQESENLIEQIDPNMGQLEMNVVFSSQVNDGLDWNFEAPDKMIITEGINTMLSLKLKIILQLPILELQFLMFCRLRLDPTYSK